MSFISAFSSRASGFRAFSSAPSGCNICSQITPMYSHYKGERYKVLVRDKDAQMTESNQTMINKWIPRLMCGGAVSDKFWTSVHRGSGVNVFNLPDFRTRFILMGTEKNNSAIALATLKTVEVAQKRIHVVHVPIMRNEWSALLIAHGILSMKSVYSNEHIDTALVVRNAPTPVLEKEGFVPCCSVGLEQNKQIDPPKNRGLFLRQYLSESKEKVLGLPADLDEVFFPIIAAENPALAAVLEEWNIQPERGILLYGPPGTGKTSVARNIGKFLDIPDERIRIKSATELLAKYVGDTESNIRKLFESAIKEKTDAEQQGRKPRRHLIVLDEFDSLARSRKFADRSWENTQVNQLLTCIDGFIQLPHIVVIAITNNKEIVDPALLRYGRLGVHIKLDVPTPEQRKEIVQHYLQPFLDRKLIASGLNIDRIAQAMTGYTGADIKGLINAVSRKQLFQSLRQIKKDGSDLDSTLDRLKNREIGLITEADFLKEINKAEDAIDYRKYII